MHDLDLESRKSKEMPLRFRTRFTVARPRLDHQLTIDAEKSSQIPAMTPKILDALHHGLSRIGIQWRYQVASRPGGCCIGGASEPTFGSVQGRFDAMPCD